MLNLCPREVELVDGADQREVADADQLGELVGATAVSPGDRDDQAEVGPDDPLLDRHRRGAEPLELLHIGPPRPVGVEAGACPLGQRLQVVHLAEQVRLLLARQEGDFTEAVHLRTRALGGRGPSCDLGRWRSGHLGEDRVAGPGVVEAGVSNVLDPRRQRAADARPAGQAPAVRRRVAESGSGSRRQHLVRLMAPVGTPPNIVDRLARELNAALKSPELLGTFEKQGYEPLGGTAQEFSRYIESELAKWKAAAQIAGVQNEAIGARNTTERMMPSFQRAGRRVSRRRLARTALR